MLEDIPNSREEQLQHRLARRSFDSEGKNQRQSHAHTVSKTRQIKFSLDFGPLKLDFRNETTTESKVSELTHDNEVKELVQESQENAGAVSSQNLDTTDLSPKAKLIHKTYNATSLPEKKINLLT